MYDALLLAGGSARRLGGADKPALLVGDVPMLDRVLAACAGAAQTVVVGPQLPTPHPVTWCREDPPGGGPVPALRAGLPLITAPTVVLLAADLPFLTGDVVEQLAQRAPAVLTDGRREQWLCGAWPTERLRELAAGAGPRLGDLLGRLQPELVAWADGTPWADCDTEQDLTEARRRAEMELEAWVAAAQRELGLDEPVDLDLLLDAARDVAHGVERRAAPVTTYLLGLAVGRGATPDEAAAAVRRALP